LRQTKVQHDRPVRDADWRCFARAWCGLFEATLSSIEVPLAVPCLIVTILLLWFAGKILAAIFTMVHDTGIRWTIGPITPVVELLKNTEIFPRVRSLAVRAIYLFAKEGDRVLGLLSQVICSKTLLRCCMFYTVAKVFDQKWTIVLQCLRADANYLIWCSRASSRP